MTAFPDPKKAKTEDLVTALGNLDAAFAAHADMQRIQRGQPTLRAQDAKVRENRVRRMAERQRLNLIKSRRRDPLAPDYGKYMLWRSGDKVSGSEVVFGSDDRGYPAATLDEIEEYLKHGS